MLPFAYPAGLTPNIAVTTTVTMPANGGTLIVPFILADLICAQSMTVQTQDASQSHTVEFAIFGDNPTLPISGPVQSFTYTGSGNAVRTGNLNQPIYIQPGVAWLVLRNSGATTVILGAVGGGTLGGNLAATTTLASSLANGIGNPTWSPIANVPVIRINGSLSGVLPGATI